jgi:hypothetical protein
MAHAVKFKTVVSGKTLTHSDLDAFVGKHVEVTVEEDEAFDTNASGVAPLAAVPACPVKRRFGTMAGKFEVSADFDQLLPPDIQRYFEGEGDG